MFPVTIVSVYAITTNDIQVTASGPLLQRSVVLTGDSMNPSTWQLNRLDTGETLKIVSVTVLSPTQVLLHTLFPLPISTVQLEVSSTTLLDANGNPADPSALCYGTTEGAYATPQQSAITATTAPQDLLNRQFPAPLNQTSPLGTSAYGTPGSLSGTLVIAGGDYANQSGLDLLRKLIIRRLTATPGDFAHIPQYGVGLKVKQPLPVGDLVKLQASIKQQIMQEPDVETVAATVTQSSNVLTVQVSVTVMATGSKLDVSVPFQIGASL
jgi:hypothetical protein